MSYSLPFSASPQLAINRRLFGNPSITFPTSTGHSPDPRQCNSLVPSLSISALERPLSEPHPFASPRFSFLTVETLGTSLPSGLGKHNFKRTLCGLESVT